MRLPPIKFSLYPSPILSVSREWSLRYRRPPALWSHVRRWRAKKNALERLGIARANLSRCMKEWWWIMKCSVSHHEWDEISGESIFQSHRSGASFHSRQIVILLNEVDRFHYRCDDLSHSHEWRHSGNDWLIWSERWHLINNRTMNGRAYFTLSNIADRMKISPYNRVNH